MRFVFLDKIYSISTQTKRRKKMTGKEKTKTARIIGALFILATVVGSISALGILDPILTAPDYLVKFSENENKVIIGAILDLIGAGAFVGVAIVIFPIFKKHNEGIALGYVVARSFEAVPFIVANIMLLGLVALGQEYVKAGAPDAFYFLPSSTGLLAAYDWSQLLGPRVLAGLAALPFNYLLYQSKLIPRFISAWGLVGAMGILATGLLNMFGLDPWSPLSVLLFLPHAANEMFLAVWLIIKGFNSSASVSGSAKAAIN